jgi:hypothetical protein
MVRIGWLFGTCTVESFGTCTCTGGRGRAAAGAAQRNLSRPVDEPT